MIETALALLTAHLLADYVFQTRTMVARKREAGIFALHILVVFALSFAALGGAPLVALGVTAAHAVIDALKTWATPERHRDGLAAYLIDQAAHLATIAAAASLFPQAFGWGPLPQWLWQAALLTDGLIVTTLAAAPVIRALMAGFAEAAPTDSLPDAGRMIGLLERALIFLMVIVDEPAGIGFLIAAKSILRFGKTADDRGASEYVIIGTLASFALALALAFLTRHGVALALPLVGTPGSP